jgi:hypothetical protein
VPSAAAARRPGWLKNGSSGSRNWIVPVSRQSKRNSGPTNNRNRQRGLIPSHHEHEYERDCWLQWNAGTECNIIMLPLAAFPMHYILPPSAIQSCHLIRSGLDCQIQRFRGGMPTPVGATGSKVRLARKPGAERPN